MDLAQLATKSAARHAGSLGKLSVLSRFVKMDGGGVEQAAVEKAVLAAEERVVVGMRGVLSRMFEESKMLAIASMVVDDGTAVTKRILVICKDWDLGHRC